MSSTSHPEEVKRRGFVVEAAGVEPGIRRRESCINRPPPRDRVEELGRWIAATSKTTPPKSPLGKALYYAAHQWTPLTRFLEDGRLELHNNACERAAVIYTVLGTCRLRGIDPWAWLRDVLEKLASGWKQARIAELLPAEPDAAAAA